MHYDVIIIGSSIAGASAAYRLGQAGLSVGLFDKAQFPRRKPCGEGLARPGVRILHRLGLGDVLATTPHLPFVGYRLASQGHTAYLTTPESGGITLERETFDLALLRAAERHSTVTTHATERVITVDPSGWITTDLGSYTAKFVLLAAGANSSLTKALQLYRPRRAGQRLGASATFEGAYDVAPDRVHITITPDFEAYATPLPGGRLNISVLAAFPAHENIAQILRSSEFQEKIMSSLRFSGAMIREPLGRAPLGQRSPRAFAGQVLLIGDATEEFDPIGGMGMTHALRSAELASEAIVNVINERSSQAEAWSRYDSLRRSSAKTMRAFTALSYYTLRGAARLPYLIDLAGSPLGQRVTSFFSSRGTML